MNAQNDHRSSEEPDLDRWLAELTNSVNDEDTAAFLRPYRNWDGQEPLGDYAARGGTSRPSEQAPPTLRIAHPRLIDVHDDALTGQRSAAQVSPPTSGGPSTSSLPWVPTHPTSGHGSAGTRTGRGRRKDAGDSSEDAGERSERWRSIAAALVAAALVVVVAVAGFAVLRKPTAPIAAQPATTFSFTYPVDGAEVTSPLVLRGTAKLPPNQVLWILVREKNGDDPLYYLTTDAPIAVDGTGHWTSRLKLGASAKDIGQTSVLYAVTSPPDGTLDQEIGRRPSSQYSVRLQDVPADCTLVGQVSVTLTK